VGFRVEGWGFKVEGAGSRVEEKLQILRLHVSQGSAFRVWGFNFLNLHPM